MGNFSSFQQRKSKKSSTVSPASMKAADGAVAQVPKEPHYGWNLAHVSLVADPRTSPFVNTPTGLPAPLQAGVEHLSGITMDDVRVHYHSSQPAKVDALAYTQGTDIHVGPGQEQHLAHEAWHVVQQKQGRVRPTLQFYGARINDDLVLEREAERMGARAATSESTGQHAQIIQARHNVPGNVRSLSPFAASSPIQRIGEAKTSIAQPLAGGSADVPDLTAALVKKIQDATNTAERQDALEKVIKYLDSKGAIDDVNRTEIKYVHRNNANYAVTQVVGMKDDDPIRITVYRNAFDAGVPALYSAIRHELIHVGQRLLVPDDKKAEGTDEYLHENIYDKNIGVKTRDTLQKPLQEIEVHVWELVHASETGIVADAVYLKATIKDLVVYTQLLTKTVKDKAELPQVSFTYWREYLDNAVTLLNDAYNSVAPAMQKAIKDARTALQAAITLRTTRPRARSMSGKMASKPVAKKSSKRKITSKPSPGLLKRSKTIGGGP
jgi:Domain of unknown function (DUF4157)